MSPIVLTTASELYALMQSTNAGDMENSYTLGNDIDMTSYLSESIGKLSTPFIGNFNGNGHTITIGNTLDNNYFGLFGVVGPDSTVITLTIIYTQDITIHSLTDTYFGGICGISDSTTTIDNTTVIYNSNVHITISSTGFIKHGGCIGHNNGVCTNNIVTLYDSVVFSSTSSNNELSLGGIVGSNNGSVSGITLNCSNNILFTGNSFNDCCIGGNIGRNYATSGNNTITFGNNISFTGNSTGGSSCYLGGNIGRNSGGESNSNIITFGYSIFFGNNIAFTDNSLFYYLGGNIGRNDSGTSNSNTITFGNDVTFTCNSSDSNFGGNIGFNDSGTSNNNTITFGDIITFSGNSSVYCYLGGNIGRNSGGESNSNTINFGINIRFTGDSTETCYLGGNIGRNSGGGSNSSTITFKDTVTFTCNAITKGYLGGNIGFNDTSTSNTNNITFGNYISFIVHSVNDACYIGGNIGNNFTSTSTNDRITFGDNINILSTSLFSDNIGGNVGINELSTLSNSIVNYGKNIRIESVNAIIGPASNTIVIGNICGCIYGNNTITDNRTIINDKLTVKVNSGSSGISIDSYIGYIDRGINTITNNSVTLNSAILQYNTYPIAIPKGIIYSDNQYPFGSRIIAPMFSINVDDIIIYVLGYTLDITCNGGNTSLNINWNKPVNRDSSLISYYYKIYKSVDPPPTSYTLWGASIRSGPFSLNKGNLDAGVEYTVDMYASDRFIPLTPSVIKTATPVAANTTWSGSENVGAIPVQFTNALTYSTLAVQTTSLTNINSIGSTVTVTTTDAATLVAGNVAKDDVQPFVDTQSPDKKYIGTIALSATPTTSATIGFTTTVTEQPGTNIIIVVEKCMSGETTEPVGTSQSIQVGDSGIITAQVLVAFLQSIYIISYIVIQPEQPVQCCIPTPIVNQSYNNNLYTEQGYTEQRENRILAGGYYRGPVDSSTLTRIRQGNGVLLHQSGVDGGFRGSL